MATLQNRDGRWRAIVRRKGHPTQTRTSPTKTAAKTWAHRIEREMSDLEARGGAPREEITIAELIAWRMEALSSVTVHPALGMVIGPKLSAFQFLFASKGNTSDSR